MYKECAYRGADHGSLLLQRSRGNRFLNSQGTNRKSIFKGAAIVDDDLRKKIGDLVPLVIT